MECMNLVGSSSVLIPPPPSKISVFGDIHDSVPFEAVTCCADASNTSNRMVKPRDPCVTSEIESTDSVTAYPARSGTFDVRSAAQQDNDWLTFSR